LVCRMDFPASVSVRMTSMRSSPARSRSTE
jgi:hypothetical protein